MAGAEAVREGFSRKAAPYDERIRSDPVDRWARGIVRARVLAVAPPGCSILELNAGTGADAAFLAGRGFRVHATDLADGMVEAIRAKAADPALGGRLTVEQRDFHALDGVGGPFDVVLSNFGGLNCTNRLDLVGRAVAGVLRPGGFAVLVVMPPVSPWEHAQIVRGHWRTAVRRWRPGGVVANIEGIGVRTWYHSPGRVAQAFGAAFRLRDVRSVGLFAPPMFLESFPRRHPRITAAGMRLDERVGSRWPFNRAGDFSILTLERTERRDRADRAATSADR